VSNLHFPPYKRLPLDHVLNQTKLLHTLISYFFKFHFNIIPQHRESPTLSNLSAKILQTILLFGVGPTCPIRLAFLEMSSLKFGQKNVNFWSLRHEGVIASSTLKFV
jgi:hypothetical protein